MLRATTVVRKAAVKAERVADTVTLDHDGRSRRRVALKADAGLDFLLDLDKATVLNDGDAVKLEDGRLVRVKAAPQRLLEVRAENPLRLLRVAYHVGNRHAPAEVAAEAVYIEDDHVLAEMARGLGCTVVPVLRPFQPERGAYEHDCGHDHGSAGHGHDHHRHGEAHHHHGHDHGHGHDRGPSEHHAHHHGDHRHGEAHYHHGHDHDGSSEHHAHDHHRHGRHDHGHDHAAGAAGGHDRPDHGHEHGR